jgi:hypothetical protein
MPLVVVATHTAELPEGTDRSFDVRFELDARVWTGPFNIVNDSTRKLFDPFERMYN